MNFKLPYFHFNLLGRACAFSGTILLGLVLQGCDPQNAAVGDPTVAIERLYGSYLNGNAGEARESLHEAEHLIEQITSAHGHANGLAWTYSRLYTLEARQGNSNLAEVYFIKARYWFVRDGEVGNRLAQDIGKTMISFTTNACVEMVDEWDRKHSNGRGAKYSLKH